jgi:hypothetical protein
VIRRTALSDTRGDRLGPLIEQTLIDVRGKHPTYAEDFPFCEIAAELKPERADGRLFATTYGCRPRRPAKDVTLRVRPRPTHDHVT